MRERLLRWQSIRRASLVLSLWIAAACTNAPQPAASLAPARERLLLQESTAEGELLVDVVVDGRGPTVLMLPSSQRDSLDFDEVAGLIASSGFKVLRPQPRGFGRSRGPMHDLDLSALAGDVSRVIDRLGGGRAILVGHAYGHFIARVADLEHPAKVRGVVVLGAAAKSFPPGMVNALTIASSPDQPREERLRNLRIAMFAPGNDPTPWLDGWYPQLRDIYREAGARPPKERWWNQTNAPILDLQGGEDPWRPTSTRHELKDLLGEKVTVQVIPRASHALIPEQPQAVARAIVDWARRLPP